MKVPLERVVKVGSCLISVYDGLERGNGVIELSDDATIRKTYVDQFGHRTMMSLERKCLVPGIDVLGDCESALLTTFAAEIETKLSRKT